MICWLKENILELLSLLTTIGIFIIGLIIWRRQKLFEARIFKKNHVSQKRFDAEFSIYQKLSKAFYNLLKQIQTMTPQSGFQVLPEAENESKNMKLEIYNNTGEIIIEVQDSLYESAPLIPLKFFNQYESLLILCKNCLTEEEIALTMNQPDAETDRQEARLRGKSLSKEINDKFTALNDSIREYLNNLELAI
jgi:hypothetical protein